MDFKGRAQAIFHFSHPILAITCYLEASPIIFIIVLVYILNQKC